MRLILKFFAFLIASIAVATVPAQTLSFYSATAPATITYSPFSETSGTGTLAARLTRYKNKAVSYYFTCFTPITSRYVSLSGVTIPIDVYKSGVTPYATILPWSRSVTYSDVLYGTFTANGTQYQSYDVVPEIGHWVQAGTYTGSLKFELDQGTPGTDNLMGSKTVSVSVLVPPIADLSIVAAGTTFDVGSTSQIINFGDLTPGVQGTLNVLIRSNKPWSLTLSAPSGGHMTKASSDTQIPYSFYFNNNLINLTSGAATLVSTTGWTSTGQNDYPVKIIIGDFDFAEPGTYQDNISLTLSTN